MRKYVYSWMQDFHWRQYYKFPYCDLPEQHEIKFRSYLKLVKQDAGKTYCVRSIYQPDHVEWIFFKKKVLENELSVRLIFVMPYSEAYSKNAGKRGRKNLLWQLNLSTWPCWMDFLKKYSWKRICIQNGYGPFWVFDSYFSYLILKSTVLGLVLVERDAESCASDATWLMIVDGIIKSVLMASKKMKNEFIIMNPLPGGLIGESHTFIWRLQLTPIYRCSQLNLQFVNLDRLSKCIFNSCAEFIIRSHFDFKIFVIIFDAL